MINQEFVRETKSDDQSERRTMSQAASKLGHMIRSNGLISDVIEGTRGLFLSL